MRHKKPENRSLPPRMKIRKRTLKSGKVWIGYYYDGRDENNNRIEIALGTDLNEAKKKWAELELTEAPKDQKTLGWLFNHYINNGMSHLSKRSKDDYNDYMKQLRKVFELAPIDEVEPVDIAGYRDARTAKVRANREIAMLSIVYNYAIEKGFAKYNPAEKVKKNKEKPRDYYAYDDVFFAVYKHATQELKDLLMLSYLTGQRPADVHKIRTSHITNDHLFIGQNKRGHKLRIKLNNEQGRTALGKLIDDILLRKNDDCPYLITVDGQALTYSMRRYRFETARASAAKEALEKNDIELSELILAFQFKDTRPKAASDMNDISAASKLLGHTKEDITKKIYIRIGQEAEPLERK